MTGQIGTCKLTNPRRPTLSHGALVGCITLALVGTASATDMPTAHTTLGAPPVFNCNDNGPGSLRLSIAGAVSGSTVDVSSLSCSKITLTTGALVVTQNDLTLLGPADGSVTIDGSGQDRVLQHNGIGTVTILHLDVANGAYDGGSGGGSPAGGCIYSAASVNLFDVHVSDCSVAANTAGSARGGGVFTAADLTLRYSAIADSSISNTLGNVIGGGAYVGGVFTSTYSTISDNSAVAYAPYAGVAGGVAAFGSVVTVTGSAIVNNFASDSTGGLAIICCTTTASSIVNSTISSNSSGGVAGGLVTGGPTTLSNSTVAFNIAATSLLNGEPAAAGVIPQTYTLDIQSSIISNNYAGGTLLDLSVFGGGSVIGADSLVMAPVTTVPADTLVGVDPQLAPLTGNGGLTPSHAIGPSSPALDVGNNAANLLTDQRGPGFPRTLVGGTDIGAFEFDPDRIFADGFDR